VSEEEPILEAIPVTPPKKKRKKQYTKEQLALLASKKAIVKRNHQLWRKHPELAPKGWEDNKRGE
jgi:hypothetical protein